jgi:DNA-binding NarL/FixJ family response regulator
MSLADGSAWRGAPLSIRVVIAEDSYLAQQGIVRALEKIEDVQVIAICDDLKSARSAIDETLPDVVLTDIRMPPGNTDEGLQLAAELRRSHPDIGVVLLSQHSEPLYAMELFEPRADRRGYLLKERLASHRDLSLALHHVADGGAYVDPAVVSPLLHSFVASPLDSLTVREMEILTMLADGKSNLAIATETGVTKRAIERHINSIFGKLGLGQDEAVNRRVKAVLIFAAEAAPRPRPSSETDRSSGAH